MNPPAISPAAARAFTAVKEFCNHNPYPAAYIRRVSHSSAFQILAGEPFKIAVTIQQADVQTRRYHRTYKIALPELNIVVLQEQLQRRAGGVPVVIIGAATCKRKRVSA